MRIKVIGLGGIGLYLLDPLSRYLVYAKPFKGLPSITLIDGDQFEEHNATRQSFARLGNKAMVTCHAMRVAFPEIAWSIESKYLDETNVAGLVLEGDAVFCAVDNYGSKRILSEYCSKLKNVLVISGGNDQDATGEVQCMHRKDGQDMRLPLANCFHKEIAEAKTDNHPNVLARQTGCEEKAKISEPQLVLTNFWVAGSMLAAFYAFVRGKLDYDDVYLNVLTNTVCSANRKEIDSCPTN